MTKQRDFKALVRERMDKTGERYTAARAQLLGKASTPPRTQHSFPGVLPGYDTFGGIQSGTAAASQHARIHGQRLGDRWSAVHRIAGQRSLRRSGVPLCRLRIQGMAADAVAGPAQPLDA